MVSMKGSYLYNDEEIAELIEVIEKLEIRTTQLQDLISLGQPIESLIVQCKRDLHNLKGTLGMLGFTDQMTFIHKVENYFCNEFKGKELAVFLGYFSDILSDLAISIEKNKSFDYHFDEILSLGLKKTESKTEMKNTMEPVSDISNILESENRKLAAHKSKLKSSIIVIGKNSDVSPYVADNSVSVISFNSSFDVYKSFQELGHVVLAIIDTDYVTENPFLFQSAIHKFSPKTEFLYIVSDYEEFGEFLEEQTDGILSLSITSKANARQNISKFFADIHQLNKF